MKFTPLLTLSIIFALAGCTPPTPTKSELPSRLDSIAKANEQSVLASGENITKAYINAEDSSFFIVANMRLDHRIIGYEKPDTSSAGLILFSIFTDDVDGNPFQYPLGAYYDSYDLENLNLKYLGESKGFSEILATNATGESTTLFFERKWVIFENEELGNTLSDDVLDDFGQITSIEDGVYPMFVLRVQFEDRDFFIDFDVNIESIAMDVNELMAAKNHYARIYYTSQLENQLMDLQFDGNSLFGEYGPEKIDPEWKSFTGTLGGAETATSGDLPSTISLYNEQQENLQFKVYVDDVLQAYNGKTIKAYYTTRAKNEILGISLAETE